MPTCMSALAFQVYVPLKPNVKVKCFEWNNIHVYNIFHGLDIPKIFLFYFNILRMCIESQVFWKSNILPR